jgi:P27 family predicted phage terminase small subunit
MTVRGRKPKPAHLQLVEGNTGHRPVEKRKIYKKPGSRADAVPRLPKGCKPEVAVIWRKAMRNAPMGVLMGCDADLLYLWCQARYNYDEAERKYYASSMLIKLDNGRVVQSPYLRVMKDEREFMRKVAGDLGFAPTARTRIGADNVETSDDDDASDDFD